jgi:hypothetical protein
MFGRHKMTHDGTATVISCSDAAHSMMWTTGAHKYSKYDLILDVHPMGGSVFRAATEASFAIFTAPTPGDQLKVRCNPERQLVEVDIDGDPRFNMKLHDQSAKAEREAQYERDLAAPPGTPPAAYSAPPPGAGADSNLDPELQELMRLEEDERRGGSSPAG